MPVDTQHYDVGLVYASNLYSCQQLFEMHKVYVVKQIHNQDLNMQTCALMDGDTYSGFLIAGAKHMVSHLLQPGYIVKVRVTKVNATQLGRFSNALNRYQDWTHGRGDCWHEVDGAGTQGRNADRDGKAEDVSQAGKGFDGQADFKSMAARHSSSGQSSAE